MVEGFSLGELIHERVKVARCNVENERVKAMFAEATEETIEDCKRARVRELIEKIWEIINKTSDEVLAHGRAEIHANTDKIVVRMLDTVSGQEKLTEIPNGSAEITQQVFPMLRNFFESEKLILPMGNDEDSWCFFVKLD